jgi:hypothetical protein
LQARLEGDFKEWSWALAAVPSRRMATWIVRMRAVQKENDEDSTSPDLVEQVATGWASVRNKRPRERGVGPYQN